MPADYSISTINKLLKVVQEDKDATDLILNDFPTLGMMKVANDFVGENYQFALSGGGGQGVSVDFESAIANATASNDLKPIVTRGQIYGYSTMTREAMLACAGKKGGYTDLVKKVKKDMDRGLRRALGAFVFGDGGGSFGRIKAGSAVNTNILELRDKNTSVFFEKGMRLETSITNGTSGAVRVGFVTILAVDRGTGKLTLDQALNTGISLPTADDWVFVKGNHATSYGSRVIAGIQAWIPKTSPTPGENFFGIDRSVDPFRFAGVRYLEGGSTIKEAILLGLALAGREGCDPKAIVMNPVDFGAFANSLDNKSDTVRLQAANADIGYEGVKISSPTQSGKLAVLGDASVAIGDAWCLNFDDWKVKTLTSSGKFPELIQMPGEGGYLERIPTRDAYAVRYGGFANLICDNPANQAYIKLPTAPAV